MARPALYDDALRDRLLDVTAELVDHVGPERLSLREVAQRADTSTSAVYALFGGKAALLRAVIEHGFASFGAAQAASASDGLRALGVAYRTWALENPSLYRLMFGGAIIADDCTPDAEVTGSALQPLIQTVAPRVTDVDTMPAVLTIWAQVHGAVSLELADVGPVDIDWDAVYRRVLDAVERAFPPGTERPE